MSATDRTLLAALSFADPDKKDGLHSLAQQYLAQPEVAEKFAKDFVEWARGEGGGVKIEVLLEVPISKGKDQYKQTIGFMDVVMYFSSSAPRSLVDRVIEVKAHPVDMPTVLRQINLYREHLPYQATWVLVTLFDLSEADTQALKAADVEYVRLGDDFTRWRAEAVKKKGEPFSHPLSKNFLTPFPSRMYTKGLHGTSPLRFRQPG